MHAEAAGMASVLRLRIEHQGEHHERELVLKDQVCIGRESDCDVVLRSSTVSRKHVSFLARKGRLVVRDHSSNGTEVDGSPLRLAVRDVGQGCELRIGPYHVNAQLVSATPSGRDDEAPCADLDVGLRRQMREALLESLDLVGMERAEMQPDILRPRVVAALERIAKGMGDALPEGERRQSVIEQLCHEVLGLGPLEPLLSDPEVSEVMVVDANTIYAERKGRIERSALRFTDDTAVRAVLERIVTPLGRRIDESSPIVDARLPDGSRVNAVIPPLALKGPCITIRKFPKRCLSLDELVARGSLSAPMATFLKRSVHVRCNIVICGGTGSGKTTLLNLLSAAIGAEERVVTIEDAAELSLQQRHVVSLEARPSNMEGKGAVTIRDLVKNALRMRPDRIVVGECRGGEALDMLQAMNTGHEGSMTTTHANSPAEAVQRLETLCLMSGLDLPVGAIRRQLGASIDLFVQQARFSDGSRRVTHVTEVAGLNEHGEVELRDLYRFERRGTGPEGQIQGDFAATGCVPRFVDRFLTHGLLGEEERA